MTIGAPSARIITRRPISLIYGLREALRIVLEEGLEARWERHRAISRR